MGNSIKMKLCPDCNIELIKTDEHIVCPLCGVVSKNMMNECGSGGEAEDEYQDSTENMTSFIPKGSKTYVVRNGKYVYCDIYRLNVQCQYDKDTRSKDLVTNAIENMCIGKYSNKIISCSVDIWSVIHESGQVFRGQIRKGLIANCIFYSCIQNDRPTIISELCQDIKTDIVIFNKSHTIFKNLISKTKWKFLLSKKVDVSNYFCVLTSLFNQPELYSKCIKVYSLLDQSNIIHNHDIRNIACAIIHYVDKSLDLKYVCGTCGVAVSTIEKIIVKLESMI
jgi:DNA-directed RNA polymerase subunit RPC12/RpoP